MDRLTDAIAYAQAQLPIKTVNDLMGVLGLYHNTLLKEQEHVSSHSNSQ
jgi:hypothetical protein